MRGIRRLREGAAAAAAVIIVGGLCAPGAGAATPAPPFNECPPIGADPSCALLIVIADAGVTVVGDPALGPYDGSDDTTVGILNSSTSAVGSLPLSSTSKPIFGFEDDGICSGPFDNGSGTSIAPPGGCPFGSTGYEGPQTVFSAISADTMSGTVNFTTPLPPGGSAYFSLEETLLSTDHHPGHAVDDAGRGRYPDDRHARLGPGDRRQDDLRHGDRHRRQRTHRLDHLHRVRPRRPDL